MSQYYYTYVLDDNNFVHKMYENLSADDKERVKREAPFGFTVEEYNKPIPLGRRFPFHRQEMTVKNICNIVVLGDEINVRT